MNSSQTAGDTVLNLTHICEGWTWWSGEALCGMLMRDVAHPTMQLGQGDSCVRYAGTGLRQ